MPSSEILEDGFPMSKSARGRTLFILAGAATTPDLPGADGTGGWTADDKSVLLYDKFDVWEVRPDGTGARMVTAGEGRKQEITFRYRPLDPEEQFVPANRPLLLSAVNDRTRATGFYRVASLAATAAPEKVVMLDKAFGAPTKAKDARGPLGAGHRVD